jgi:hypothetical protein
MRPGPHHDKWLSLPDHLASIECSLGRIRNAATCAQTPPISVTYLLFFRTIFLTRHDARSDRVKTTAARRNFAPMFQITCVGFPAQEFLVELSDAIFSHDARSDSGLRVIAIVSVSVAVPSLVATVSVSALLKLGLPA